MAIGLLSSQGYAQQTKKKAVFIIVDGISADQLERAQAPAMRRIGETGRYLRMYQGGRAGSYTESPTISAVGYNNVLTGVWYNKHNVPDNDIKEPNYHYPTIFRLMRDAKPEASLAIFSSWEDNRTKLVGEGLEQTGNLALDEAFDGYELDTLNYPHDAERQFMSRIDSVVSLRAAETILDKSPDLSWVYLEFSDDMGHKYGDSPQFRQAIQKMDQAVARVYDAVEKREKEFGEDWLVIITTDHGRDEKTGRGHGGQSYRQRSAWLIANKPLDNAYANAFYPAAVDIAPTIARHLDIEVPKQTLWEWDGVPLSGEVSLADASAHVYGNTFDLSWLPLKSMGELRVWLSRTNLKKSEGSEDAYELLGSFPLSEKHAVIELSGDKPTPGSVWKIVLETADNSLNRWLIQE